MKRKQENIQKTTMLNSLQHPHLNQSLSRAEEIPGHRIKILRGLAKGNTSVRDDNRRKGFTLIELLVVVLIVGILAAVAVPQYQKAVYKSRAVEAVTVLKALVDAQEIYYLANGEYTDDISKLDVNIPQELVTTFGNVLFEDKYSYTCSRKTECMAVVNNNNLPSFQFNFRHVDDVDAGKFYCTLGSDDSKTDMAKSICQSMGRLDETRTQEWAVGKYFIIN